MSGRICPTCERASVPRAMLLESIGLDPDAACDALIQRDGGKHLEGMAECHPAALVRALARALIAARCGNSQLHQQEKP